MTKEIIIEKNEVGYECIYLEYMLNGVMNYSMVNIDEVILYGQESGHDFTELGPEPYDWIIDLDAECIIDYDLFCKYILYALENIFIIPLN